MLELVRTAWLRPPLVCFLLGLLGVVPLVILTPPFQVPDENQHFYRAYQLSELRMGGTVRDGAAGAILPSSLIELTDRFTGSRALWPDKPITVQPLRGTWLAFDRPLDPDRRDFISTSTANSSPLPYLPQSIRQKAGSVGFRSGRSQWCLGCVIHLGSSRRSESPRGGRLLASTTLLVNI